MGRPKADKKNAATSEPAAAETVKPGPVMFMSVEAARVDAMTDAEVLALAPGSMDEIQAAQAHVQIAELDLGGPDVEPLVVRSRRALAKTAVEAFKEPWPEVGQVGQGTSTATPVDQVSTKEKEFDEANAKRDHFQRMQDALAEIWDFAADGHLPTVDELLSLAPRSKGVVLDTIDQVRDVVKASRVSSAPQGNAGYSNQPKIEPKTPAPPPPPAAPPGSGYSFHGKK